MKEEEEAQELINEVEKKPTIDYIKWFYPTLWNQEQANRNITKICKKLK
ncbi:MAG: hypothetical protein ACTSUC_09715 [Promethearchaeota archaeon]